MRKFFLVHQSCRRGFRDGRGRSTRFCPSGVRPSGRTSGRLFFLVHQIRIRSTRRSQREITKGSQRLEATWEDDDGEHRGNDALRLAKLLDMESCLSDGLSLSGLTQVHEALKASHRELVLTQQTEAKEAGGRLLSYRRLHRESLYMTSSRVQARLARHAKVSW